MHDNKNKVSKYNMYINKINCGYKIHFFIERKYIVFSDLIELVIYIFARI